MIALDKTLMTEQESCCVFKCEWLRSRPQNRQKPFHFLSDISKHALVMFKILFLFFFGFYNDPIKKKHIDQSLGIAFKKTGKVSLYWEMERKLKLCFMMSMSLLVGDYILSTSPHKSKRWYFAEKTKLHQEKEMVITYSLIFLGRAEKRRFGWSIELIYDMIWARYCTFAGCS